MLGLCEGKVLCQVVLLVMYYGLLLLEVVYDIDKYLNNVMVCQLFLMIGVEIGCKFVLVWQLIEVINQWFVKQNLMMLELVLENGLGLLCIECISVCNMGCLLQQVDVNLNGGVLCDVLFVVGVDGIMCNCLICVGVVGNVEIKIGMFNDVCVIVGYVEGENGECFVVVSMINYLNVSGGQVVYDVLL